jgi:hypothetical protein
LTQVQKALEYYGKQYLIKQSYLQRSFSVRIMQGRKKMKPKYPTNSKSYIKNNCIIVLACVVIGIVLYGCKKEEPQQEENSPSVSAPLEQKTPTEQAQSEPAEEIQSGNSIELAKWKEGKALAETVAVTLRAFAAENDMNIDYENITVQKLFPDSDDLRGYYFDINDIKLSDVSFDQNRSEHQLRYTITVTRPDDSRKIKSFKLLHTGQWIQTP